MTNNEKLIGAFHNALGISLELVVDTLSYQSIPEWDSISHMVLIAEIEGVFDISLETDDVINLSSFGKTKEILNKYKIDF